MAVSLGLSRQTAFALLRAGYLPSSSEGLDSVPRSGFRIRPIHSGATYVYAKLWPVAPKRQDALRRAIADILNDDQGWRDAMLRVYATALRAEGFIVEMLAPGSHRARLRVTSNPSTSQHAATEKS
ncbi:hypothetical protein [Streptomyces sp. NPDC088752]|uniref:hypothetical protein n=1 Tax=Streptomyces sp. NPDC088752 TaxID=3154963 RepID=UPI00343B5F97